MEHLNGPCTGPRCDVCAEMRLILRLRPEATFDAIAEGPIEIGNLVALGADGKVRRMSGWRVKHEG